ncbi:MAG: STAS domain-containing protein [Actinomycetes bacterium]
MCSTVPLLASTLVVRHDVAVVTVLGDLDLAGTDTIRVQLGRACALAVRAVVVDVSQLRFLDCRGARSLVRSRSRALEDGKAFALAAPTPGLGRYLHLTGVDRQVPTYDSIGQAVDRLLGRRPAA